ncbi:hypothetical protein Ddye_007166 [Dipteronia dyeriana]|uniref:Uncharacterized protein n=1 Tax=Dipteronia dyeriana TaxID=168575 RepID=A0AAD9XJU0_9ROSI|nr:hypothetical protein Ddye_007166 [Dipteronia dyeriana]
MAASSFYSLILLISLLSTTFTSMQGFIDDRLIQQVVSSDGRDDLLTSAEHQFSAFKKKYGKTYPTQDEEDYRFGVFISNLRRARRNQMMDPTAVHGVTKFSDLTPSEFGRRYLGSGRQIQLSKDLSKGPILPTDDLPLTMNWTAKGAVTPVKNQGTCDGCWAFSTIAVLEGAHFLANGQLFNLSEQQLIDCSTECNKNGKVCNHGCEGGNRVLAFKYMENSGGVVQAKNYRFIGNNSGLCNVTENSQIVASLCRFHLIEDDHDQYAANLVKHGPIAVSIPIKFLPAQTYTGGVFCPQVNCMSNEITRHAVVLVGYNNGTSTDSDQKKVFSWIVKNSWGNDWGEGGFFRVCRGLLKACGNHPVALYAIAKNNTTGSCA